MKLLSKIYLLFCLASIVATGICCGRSMRSASNNNSFTPPTNDSGEARSRSPEETKRARTCQDVIDRIGELRPGRGNLPEDFPEPPPGSILCGSDNVTTVHYQNGLSPDAIIQYYRGALGRNGYEVWDVDVSTSEVSEGVGARSIDFRRSGVGFGGITAGGNNAPISIYFNRARNYTNTK